MKLALPAVAIGLILLIVIWPQLEREGRVAIESLNITEQDLSGRTMLNPRYESFDSNDRPFTITADEAAQNSANEALINLAAPKARLELESGKWVEIAAPKGHYNESDEWVQLNGGVALNHDDGITMNTEAVNLRLKDGVAVSRTPVTGKAPEGELEGESFRMIDEGRIIFLNGKSRLVLYERSSSDDSVPAESGNENQEKEAETQ